MRRNLIESCRSWQWALFTTLTQTHQGHRLGPIQITVHYTTVQCPLHYVCTTLASHTPPQTPKLFCHPLPLCSLFSFPPRNFSPRHDTAILFRKPPDDLFSHSSSRPRTSRVLCVCVKRTRSLEVVVWPGLSSSLLFLDADPFCVFCHRSLRPAAFLLPGPLRSAPARLRLLDS